MILERCCYYSTYGIEVFSDLADNGLLGCRRVVGENSGKRSHFSETLLMFYSTIVVYVELNTSNHCSKETIEQLYSCGSENRAIPFIILKRPD